MRKTVIEAKNVTKEYNVYKNSRDRIRGALLHRHKGYTKSALNNISFEIKRGETVGLYGNRGCGRSSLIRLVAGISNPTSGTIVARGDITYISGLTYGFDPTLSGRKNIYIKGTTLGISKDVLKSLEQEIIEFAEMEDIIDMPLKSYNAGYAARLGFSIVACFQPEILIIDDPLYFVDGAFREKCLKKIKELTSAKGCTLLITQNVPTTLVRLCDRVLLMENGEIVFDGEPKEAIQEFRQKYRKGAKAAANETNNSTSSAEEDFDDEEDEI